jgi:hypothetical protein
LTLITGPIDSTAIRIGSDIASLLNNKLRIFPVVGRGAIQNVADLLSLQQVDLVVTRTDILDYLDRKGFADKRQLAYIAKLYNEEMMVIAPNSVHSLKDLEGKHVGIDLPGEGTFVSAQIVFNQYSIHSTFDYAARPIALEKLKQGTLDAVIILASKPYDPVQNFDSTIAFTSSPSPTTTLSEPTTFRQALQLPITRTLSPTMTAASIPLPFQRFLSPLTPSPAPTFTKNSQLLWTPFLIDSRPSNNPHIYQSGEMYRYQPRSPTGAGSQPPNNG